MAIIPHLACLCCYSVVNLALVLIDLDSTYCLVFLHFVRSIMNLILSSKVLIASPSFGIIGQVINALLVPFFVINENAQ